MTAAILLPERLDLIAARPLARDLAAATGDLRLDASAVRFLGGQCLQILLASARHSAAAGRGFAIASPSTEFGDALRVFGVDPALLPEDGA